MNHASLIRKWLRLQTFADDIGVDRNTAKMMRWRASIPGGYWREMVAGAKKRGIKGVTYEALAKGASRRKTTRSKKQDAELKISEGMS